jgi:hypothetical protein
MDGVSGAKLFYRQLCAKEITVEMMQKLENEIPVLQCKKEKFFPPGFFNPMQHLLIHLSYEAKVGGLVQYRWMYHTETTLIYLKPMVGNRARVEGCITEAFMLKEIEYFSSVYFAEDFSGHKTEFVEDPLESPEVKQKRWTRKSNYVAPPPVPTNPESRPIINPVGER